MWHKEKKVDCLYLKFTHYVITLTPQFTHTVLMYVNVDPNFEVGLKVFAPASHVSLAISLLATLGSAPLAEQPLQTQRGAQRVEQHTL